MHIEIQEQGKNISTFYTMNYMLYLRKETLVLNVQNNIVNYVYIGIAKIWHDLEKING
jgi:hypothetical protein